MSSLFENNFYVRFSFCLFAVFFFAMPTAGAESEIQVVKIAAEGGGAVVKTKKGRLKAVRVGDRLAPYGKITVISSRHIVLVNDKAETTFIDIRNGSQNIRRVRKVNRNAPKRNIIGAVPGSFNGSEEDKAGSVYEGRKKSKSTNE